MSGKAYSLKEMKNIVDYLTEHKAFAEIKGRKMWMDFANSKSTNRTWQSLKETFLKRILPDIHNPYYKLTVDQIRSFRDGYDVIAREKSKLEIFEIEDDSNSNAEKETETEKPSTSHDKNGEATSGEDVTCAKIQSHDRASVDTVIIANCYETDDDLRRVLESESSPKSDNNGNPNKATTTKSLRDLITYSEPLTPMLQEVLNDFASEDESDGELRMQIVENDVDSDLVNVNKDPVIEIFDSDDIVEKNTAENILTKDESTEDNLQQDNATEDNLSKDTKGNPTKDTAAEDNSKTNKATESNSKKNKSTEDTLKKDIETKGNLKKDKAVGDIKKKDVSKDHTIESNKGTKDISKNEKFTEATIENSKPTETNNSGEIKNKAIENPLDNAIEKLEDNELVDTEEFLQPKVLSLKLRKRKAVSEKIQDKKPSVKSVKSRAEMYEIVEPEILEKSSSNVPQVDVLSNYANNKEEIVSSTVLDKPTQCSSNSDTMLPNNQEALNNSEKLADTVDQIENDISKSSNIQEKVVKPKVTRKRASSQEVASTSKVKKNKLNVNTNGKEKAVSDTDDIVMKKLIKSKLTKSKLELLKKNVIDEVENKNAKTDEITSKTGANDKETIQEDKPTSKPMIDSSQASDLNPCLKSVSLFAEQFNTVSYIDSETEHETTPAASATDKNKHNKPSTSKTSKDEKISSANKKNEKIAAENLNGKNKEMKAADIDGKLKNTKAKKIKTIAMDVDEVVMLKSHSESESETKPSSQKNELPVSQDVAKAQRDKALANVFGFYSGGLKRKKRMSYRKNAAYYQRRDESSFDSSEWTSESDSEAYVSPPRGRKNKQTRKYLKPHSARILSLEDEGGLFVMYGKKIYPLVKDGKIIKNYLTYLPESDPEEEESYWKLKYVEERKRVAELKKLMKESKEEIVRDKSPILPARPLHSLSTSHHQGTPFRNAPNKDNCKELVCAPEKESKAADNDTGKTLKITFAKNNQEVHVEGHWSHIHPMLAEVVQIFNKDADAPAGPAQAVATKRPSDATSELSVVVPSPVDEGIPRIEVLEKVNKLETEIFKEIEDRDQKEDPEPPKDQTDSNVTKRKRASSVRNSTSSQRSSAPRSSPSSTRSLKRQKTSTDGPKDELEVDKKTPTTRNEKVSKTDLKNVTPDVEKETVEAVDSTTNVATKKRTRTPKKEAKEAVNTTEVNTRASRHLKPPAKEVKANSSQVEDDSDVRYMFPPATRSRKSTLNLSKSKDKSKRYMANPPKILSLPHLPTIHDESTQGYQDSDVSPPKVNLRRKRKLSLSTVLYRNKNKNHRVKRKSFPCITDDGSSDSSSAFQIIVRPTSNSSLKSEAYRSDSYQLLFPQNKNIIRPLEKIDEDSPMPNVRLYSNEAALESQGRTLEIRLNKLNNDFLTNSSNGNTDCGNSSNVSLPMSPELSIVESLSLCKELVNSIENYPTINEMQANSTTSKVIHNKYLISQVDVSMPLMQQECGLHESLISKKIKTNSSFDQTKRSTVSDSLLNKIDTVNIEDAPSLSESLDTRLRNLLLESAKKMSITSVQEQIQSVQLTNKNETQKKGKFKRCSTPRKKKDLKKPKVPIIDPVVEEEFMESCSYGGRKSCPPAIQVISEDAIHNKNMNTDKDTVTEKNKGRRKKDVIKVKILRPKNKSLQNRSPEVTQNTSKTTVHTDSGINESGLTVQGFNDSIDLIHNHSETCLLANECMGNSVEFIETNTKSIISLNTDSATSPERIDREQFIFQDCQDFVPHLFCQNAQSFCNVNYVPESVKLNTDNTSDTVYHSPVVSEVSINSLITEDLSDETPQSSQPTKWYLLSEDDTTNTNAASRSISNSIPSSFGSNLKQIFPITCAVPDLSTITEMSNEIGRKATMDSANSTRHDLDSQSMFDMNSN